MYQEFKSQYLHKVHSKLLAESEFNLKVSASNSPTHNQNMNLESALLKII